MTQNSWTPAESADPRPARCRRRDPALHTKPAAADRSVVTATARARRGRLKVAPEAEGEGSAANSRGEEHAVREERGVRGAAGRQRVISPKVRMRERSER
ncbi:unnamed protein product [Arctogadus glacialis]